MVAATTLDVAGVASHLNAGKQVMRHASIYSVHLTATRFDTYSSDNTDAGGSGSDPYDRIVVDPSGTNVSVIS